MATKKTVAKKIAPKKAAKAKKAVKPAAKKTVTPVKKMATKKVVPPKAAPKKTVPVKPAPKALPAKKIVKPVAKTVKASKPAPVAPVKKEIQKKHSSPVSKKNQEIKAPEVKPVAKAAPPKAVKPEPVKEVKVPKTTMKTSVPYQPGYTPLEKRADAIKPNEPLVRYSDADLAEFRDLINKKMEAAKKELNYLQGLITRKDDMGSDDNDNRYLTMEDGSMSMEREQLSQMASRQITYIDHLEKAIIRIENKTYGICRVTGKLIEKARLRAVPHATLSLEAKLGLVKSNEQ